MKTGRVFWGALLVAVGFLFLLDRLLPSGVDVGSVWKLWPLVLILWGVSKLVTQRAIKLTVTIVAALLLACTIFWAVSLAWIHGDDEEWGPDPYVDEFSEPYDPGIERATLSLDFGAGTFRLTGTTPELFSASISTNIGRYGLHTEISDRKADVRFSLEGTNRTWRFGQSRNKVDVRLSDAPVWDIDINCGATKGELDLSPFRLENLTIDAGAASLTIILGTLVPETRVSVDAGASSLRIEVPAAAGCEITTETGLTSRRFPGFERIEDDIYRTENFDSANTKIYIDIEAGVSSVRVERY
ncbi:MAG: LiaI-LiaF-like domain-containing protein [Bacteroidota bacterium]